MSTYSNRASSRQDVYSEITSQLIAAIEANPGKPELPWRRSSGPLFMPVNALTKNAYNGINVVSVWVSAEVRQYSTPVWATYKQWLELGAQVRAGEKSSLVIFYKEFDAEPDPEDATNLDEAALTKMLLFERCAPPAAYAVLTNAVTASPDGKPSLLSEWEDQVAAGEQPSLAAPWYDPFICEWLALPPHLGNEDLRGILYVSREHAPLITPEDRLSSEGAELLTAILENPDMSDKLRDRLAKLPRQDLGIVMDRVLSRARRETEWGVPPILDAALTVGSIDAAQGRRVADFLRALPADSIKPSIVPKIGDQPWSGEVFGAWRDLDISSSVKRAITMKAG